MRRHDWSAELLKPKAVLGALALVIQPDLLGLRAGELAHALSATHVADRPFWSGVLFGSHLDLSTCGAIGLGLTLAQMLGASVFLAELPASAHRLCLRILSGSGWLLATALELTLSVMCAHGVEEQAIGLSVAVLLTLFETCAGILAIDHFIVPAALTLGCAIRRALRRALRRRRPPTR